MTLKTKTNPKQKSEAAPVRVTRHFRAEPVSHHVQTRRRGQQGLFPNDWKRNPAEQSGNHPVAVSTYFRAEPASAHLKVRRAGQRDLFAGLDWKRNPAGAADQLIVHYSYGNTVVTMPNGNRLTLKGTLTKSAALKKAMKKLVKANPEILPVSVSSEQTGNFVDELIEALDTNEDNDLDGADVKAYTDYNAAAEFEFNDEFEEEFDDDEFEEFEEEFDEQDDPDGIKINGFLGNWNNRRRAANEYRRELKSDQRTKKIRAKRRQYEAKLNPAALSEQIYTVQIIGTDEIPAQQIIVNDHETGERSVFPGHVVRENPGLLSGLANAGVAITSALAINREMQAKKATETSKVTKTSVKKAPTGVRGNPHKSIKHKVKRNPDGTFERFTGRDATKQTEVETSIFAPKHLDELGALHSLKLVGKSAEVFAPDNPDYLLKPDKYKRFACADKNDVIYLTGARFDKPNPEQKRGALEVLGEISHITYLQEKSHLNDQPGKPSLYRHKFGEEGGELPQLALDAEGYPVIFGGDYTIESGGIRN